MYDELFLPWTEEARKGEDCNGNNEANSSDGGEFSLKAQENSWGWKKLNYKS